MKEYIKNSNTDDIKDILKIRLHIWNVKKNSYPKHDTDIICPICRKGEDATEYLLDFEVELEKGKHTIWSSNINHCNQILKIFRDNRN